MKKTVQKEQIGVRITPAMKQKLTEMAEADSRTVGSLIFKILKEYIEQHDD